MTAQDTALMAPDQLAKLSPAQQQNYYASLSPDQAATEKQKLAAYVQMVQGNNRNFLMKSNDLYAVCPPSGGAGGTSAIFAPGTTLQFNLPSAGGAYLRELEVVIDIKFTPATGTGATYAWTPAGAYAWFSDIYLMYGGQPQGHIRPYFLKLMDILRFGQNLPYGQVISGLTADATTTSNVSQAQPALTGGTPAISRFRFRVPLQLRRDSPIGLLPIQGQGTKGLINFTCASTLGSTNPDPMQVPINFTGGTGNAITLDGVEKTVTVFAIYNNGENLQNKTPFSVNIEGLPTAQYIVDQQLAPLGSGTVNRSRITTTMKHYVALSVVIDGVQSTSFSTVGNIQNIELDKDSAGQAKFWAYGALTNTSFYDYAERIRHQYGQDMDPGVLIWTDALHDNTVNMDNGDGVKYLDMTAGHWSDTNFGVQVGAVSATNFTPRIETYLFSVNDAGLVLASS